MFGLTRLPQVQTEYFALAGGVDQTTPDIRKAPSRLIAASNYECGTFGGYRRTGGYERLDGRPAPSAAVYHLLSVANAAGIAIGSTVTGGTSAATGKVIEKVGNTLVLTKLTGTWVVGETCGGSVTTSLAIRRGANDLTLHQIYMSMAANDYRADIGAVPGAGPVRGVFVCRDVTYAFRNNSGNTACILHKATTSGWAAVTMLHEVSFTAGSGAEPAEGAVITQGGVTATLRRVVLETGTFGGGTAAGRLIVTAPAGGNFSAGAFTGGVSATCSGAATQISFSPNGRFSFDVYNFSGDGIKRRVYGCDGVNRAFEFDNLGGVDVLVPIKTGMSLDAPSHIVAHKKHLFLAFGSSLQHSGVGNPYAWTLLLGAAEIGVGDTITGMIPQATSESAKGALVVFTRNTTSVLYGEAPEWQMADSSPDTGALPYTIASAGIAQYLDDRGITEMGRTQNWGNFEHSTVSRLVQRTVEELRNLATCAFVVRSLNQYRIYFSDGRFLIYTVGKAGGFMPGFMGVDTRAPFCSWSAEDSTGGERLLLGSNNGFVYQLERGTSFDGSDIEAWMKTVFNHSKSPSMRKSYKRANFEATADGVMNVSVSIEYSNGDDYASSARLSAISSAGGGGGLWDETFVWDESFFDLPAIAGGSFRAEGTGTNISFSFYSKTSIEYSHTMTGIIMHFVPRRLQR